jgi:hypothetical protein
VNLNKKMDLDLVETLANQAGFIGAYFAPEAYIRRVKRAKKSKKQH